MGRKRQRAAFVTRVRVTLPFIWLGSVATSCLVAGEFSSGWWQSLRMAATGVQVPLVVTAAWGMMAVFGWHGPPRKK